MSFKDNLREALNFSGMEQKELAAQTGISISSLIPPCICWNLWVLFIQRVLIKKPPFHPLPCGISPCLVLQNLIYFKER
jgi:hypothetical protein